VICCEGSKLGAGNDSSYANSDPGANDPMEATLTECPDWSIAVEWMHSTQSWPPSEVDIALVDGEFAPTLAEQIG